jgi:hypothetical protein
MHSNARVGPSTLASEGITFLQKSGNTNLAIQLHIPEDLQYFHQKLEMKRQVPRTRSKWLENNTIDRKDTDVNVGLGPPGSKYGPMARFCKHGNRS